MERWEQLEQLFLGRWSPASNRADMALRDACKNIAELEAERDQLKAAAQDARSLIHWLEANAESAKVDALKAEVERLRRAFGDDMALPPQTRAYCAGCTLPADVDRLRAQIGGAES